MKRGAIVFGFVFFLVLAGIVSASVSVNKASSTIPQSFSESSLITGKINLSIRSEPASSLLSTNFEGTIKLIDFLEENGLSEGGAFNCSIRGCKSAYSTVAQISSINIADSGSPPVVGFELRGEDVEVKEVSFKIKSDAPARCRVVLFADILDRGESFVISTKTTGTVCDETYAGCFDGTLSAGSYDTTELTSDEYCERVEMPPAPGFEVGANVKNGTQGYSELKAGLYESSDSGLEFIDECTLPQNSQNGVFEELKCRINYTKSETSEYFICISSSSDLSGYKIRSETRGSICGGIEDNPKNYIRDYDVFARTLEFAPIDFNVNEDSFYDLNGISLTDYFDSYIEDNYQRNCTSGCNIPLKLLGDSQNVEIKNIAINYGVLGATLTADKMYSLEMTEPLITTGFLSLDIAKAGFTIPFGRTDSMLRLYLGSNNIFSQQISILKTEKMDISPTSALIGANTKFTVTTTMNVTSITWDFGDGSAKETASAKSKDHLYSGAGDYTLKVIVSNKTTNAEKSVIISVGNPKESAERLLGINQNRIANLSAKIKTFSGAVLNEINNYINISNLNNSLQAIRGDYQSATTDEAYKKVISDISALNVPYDIARSKIATLPASAGYGGADINLLLDITGEEIGSGKEDILKSRVIGWAEDNYDISINQEVYSAFTDSGEEPIVTKFKVTITKNGEEEGNFIIGIPQNNINFAGSYSQEDAGSSGTYIPISGSKTIEFVIPQNVEMTDLGAYMAPKSILGFSLEEEIVPFEKLFPWGWVVILLLILFILFFVLYFIIAGWYEKNYESHLFRNPEHLISIMKFIANSRKAEVANEEIKNRLLKAGWTKEQVKYGFNKLDGKRTGMLGASALFGKGKIKQEISQGEQPSFQNPPSGVAPIEMGRFIKQN